MRKLKTHIFLFYIILIITYWVQITTLIAQMITENVILEVIRTGGVLVAILLTGWVNWRLSQLHKQINSRMDELLKLNKDASKAEGVLEGKAIQKEKQAEQIIQKSDENNKEK